MSFALYIEQALFNILSSFYSVLKATTGSFLAALLDGIMPDTRVKPILISIKISAASGGKKADNVVSPVSNINNTFIGIQSI